jgi:hypothetical protein
MEKVEYKSYFRIMKLLSIIIIYFSIDITGYCQTSSTATASGSVNVIQPLSIASTGGSLSFGEIILTGSPANYQIAPAQGQSFRILGHPGRSVSIIFNQITLDNSVWVGLNGGTIGSLTFTPNVIDFSNNLITSGNFYPLATSGATAILDIRVGGSISVGASQPYGDYVGTFTISVSY